MSTKIFNRKKLGNVFLKGTDNLPKHRVNLWGSVFLGNKDDMMATLFFNLPMSKMFPDEVNIIERQFKEYVSSLVEDPPFPFVVKKKLTELQPAYKFYLCCKADTMNEVFEKVKKQPLETPVFKIEVTQDITFDEIVGVYVLKNA